MFYRKAAKAAFLPVFIRLLQKVYRGLGTAPPRICYTLSMDITNLTGIGPKRAAALAKAGIHSAEDLLNCFPRDYDDRSEIRTVESLIIGAVQTLRGTPAQAPETIPMRGAKGKSMTLTKAAIKDRTGLLELVWFNQPYLAKNFKIGQEYIFTGAVRQGSNGRLQMQSPEYEAVGEILLSGGRIVPLYTPPAGFSQKTFRALLFQLVTNCKRLPMQVTDDLPAEIQEKYRLCNRERAIKNIHFPESDEVFLQARRRLVFEELFFMQLALFQIKGNARTHAGEVFADINYAPLLKQFSFSPTQAQVKVLEEIARDLQSGRAMNRLVQGDVGSGKTAVAQVAAYLAIKNGCQAAIMAPTEVLAQQHYESFTRVFNPLGITTVLLAGSVPAGERRQVLKQIKSGAAQMIVGTHALVQKGIAYANLQLVITDEQHRFGVNQRLVLREKGTLPHTLVMTATPIPRTLALILYGDLDISIINELPAGRIPIKTYAVDSAYRPRFHEFIRKEIADGRQAYIICPAIDESLSEDDGSAPEKAALNNVLQYTKDLQKALPAVKIACLHGRMRPVEKKEIMENFHANRIQVLISTTVIEVGINVPNATIMVIENADRFGLSQLHQLRGRVGRGAAQSYCILVSDAKAQATKERLQIMAETSDGFVLAERDLEQRGAGDFFGTRQHGLPAFKIANLYRDADILKEAQEAAQNCNLQIKNAVMHRVANVL